MEHKPVAVLHLKERWYCNQVWLNIPVCFLTVLINIPGANVQCAQEDQNGIVCSFKCGVFLNQKDGI